MRADSGEKTNVEDQNPEVVAGLSKLADGIRGELGDEITGTKGVGIRVAGDVSSAIEYSCNRYGIELSIERSLTRSADSGL